MSTSVIEVHVESHYRLGVTRPILEDIRWTVAQGEHWAIIGANGAGKSTLLAIVSGDPWPSRGSVRVLGHEYGRVDKRELRKHIGVVSATLYEAFPGSDTGLDVAASGLHARIGRLGAPTAGERVRAEQALAAIGAPEVAAKRYGILSQGERQRVMIARALIAEPSLLVLDEPCAGLDPAARERFLEDLQRLAALERAPTQVIITHHLEEIPPHVSHALLLREGRILAQGTVDRVLTDDLLSETFGAPCHVRQHGDGDRRRFALTVSLTSY